MRPSQWEQFVAREPYFAVLTHEKYLCENLTPETEADFFASGEGYVDHVLDVIRKRLAPLLARRSVLEVGCGPGRLAIAFAKGFDSVTAIDISPAMLDVARRNAERFGVPNIHFASPAVLDDASTFDLVNACLVFQYIPPSEGMTLLQRLIEKIGDRGVGVFQFPYRRSTPALVAATRWSRARIPGVNRLLNAVRGKPLHFPLIHPHTYEIADILAALAAAGHEQPHIVASRAGDLDIVTFFAHRGAAILNEPEPKEDVAAPPPPPAPPAPRAATERASLPSDLIDVRDLISRSSIEDLNRAAEHYFASLEDWDGLLAKPFGKISDAPATLIGLATVLEGLQLYPGLTVLEYGAGTGWLSRYLTQLDCHAILLDVSPTALRMAEELYERQPVIGHRPRPRFLVYDGRHIDLPDASVDRVICFDAFHHAPNPEEVLAEFSRVLKPGGIAGFGEPGPQHSRTPVSQFEMRTFGVIENDVDIRFLWDAARRAGFADLRLAGFNARPFSTTLDEYEDLLAGGETYQRWANWTREFMHDARIFFLYKEGEEILDSRRAGGLGCEIEVKLLADTVRAGSPIPAKASITNTGKAAWLPSAATPGGVSLGSHLYAADGLLLRFEHHWEPLPRPLASGESITFEFALPPMPEGKYQIEFDCVAQRVSWFAMAGSRSPRVIVEVE